MSDLHPKPSDGNALNPFACKVYAALASMPIVTRDDAICDLAAFIRETAAALAGVDDGLHDCLLARMERSAEAIFDLVAVKPEPAEAA